MTELTYTMVLNGKLYSYLVEIDEAAQHRLDVLMPQLARAAGAAEDLKARGVGGADEQLQGTG